MKSGNNSCGIDTKRIVQSWPNLFQSSRTIINNAKEYIQNLIFYKKNIKIADSRYKQNFKYPHKIISDKRKMLQSAQGI
jgi:hypothetical protein